MRSGEAERYLPIECQTSGYSTAFIPHSEIPFSPDCAHNDVLINPLFVGKGEGRRGSDGHGSVKAVKSFRISCSMHELGVQSIVSSIVLP